jgi:calcium/calmodulin-dependent protein kinase kinase 2
MKAISKFKSLLATKDGVALPEDSSASCDGTTTRVPEPVVGREKAHQAMEASSVDDIAKILEERKQFLKSGGGAKLSMRILSGSGASDTESERSETLLLGIGTGGMDDFGAEPVTHDIVSDSPTAVDFNIYDQAFSDEVDRIKRSTSRKGSKGSKVYHNRLNERSHHADAALTEGPPLQAGDLDGDATPRSLASALASQQKPSRFADLVAKAMMDAKAPSQ